MTELRSPQPLGAFGIPAGFLLIDGGEDGSAVEAARETLVAGRLPREWPAELEMHRLVHADDLAGAAALVRDSADSVARYHRWLLGLDAGMSAESIVTDAAEVRAGLPSPVAPLVDVVLHTLGLGPAPVLDESDESVDSAESAESAEPVDSVDSPGSASALGRQILPGDGGATSAVFPEVRALVLAAGATEALNSGDVVGAVEALQAAAEAARDSAPVLASLLLATSGGLQADLGNCTGAADDLASAETGLAGTDLGEVRAEVLLRLGALAQARAAADTDQRIALQEAMRHYYAGLQLVDEQSSPLVWGSLNLNLATAQLAVPMASASDQLRLGVAAQSLRASRRVFTPEGYPQQWAAATLDLANALVYTPSTHQADNLVEAVELYDEVLSSGVRDADPLARARLLTNQGNAPAHLGVFDEAKPKLLEARSLFEQNLEHQSALAVGTILDEIRHAQGDSAATDADDLAQLARQADQMSRMPAQQSFTSGMGVRITRGGGGFGGAGGSVDTTPPPPPRVTVVDPATRPTKE